MNRRGFLHGVLGGFATAVTGAVAAVTGAAIVDGSSEQDLYAFGRDKLFLINSTTCTTNMNVDLMDGQSNWISLTFNHGMPRWSP